MKTFIAPNSKIDVGNKNISNGNLHLLSLSHSLLTIPHGLDSYAKSKSPQIMFS